MDWKKISLNLLVPFSIVFLLCLYAIRALGLIIMCDCFISRWGTWAVFVVGLLSLAVSVPTVLAIKKDWKSEYTLFLIFIFLIMLAVALLMGERFYMLYSAS